MDSKLSGSPFFFEGEEYAYLNGPPVPHERTAHRSRHSLVKTSKIFTFGGDCGGDCSRAGLSEPRLLPNTFSRHCPACSDDASLTLTSNLIDAFKQNTLNLIIVPSKPKGLCILHPTEGSYFVLGHNGIYPIFRSN
jgi:hypothetical protein